MRLNTSPKFISFSLKTISAAVLSALLVSPAFAAGLGKLTVLSSLGQPLNAEIELTAVSKDEAGALVPKLASVDAFRQANIDFNPALLTLRFAVDQRNGRQFIRVSSSQPINEPFVDMLLELGGGNGRLIREYTFLLDPADLRSSQSPARRSQEAPSTAAVTQPVPAPQAAVPEAPRPARPAAEKPTVRQTPAQASAAAKSATPSEYQVKKGDSLSKVAGQVRPEGVSLDQMLVALFRANPDAFAGDNMNRLKAGQILSIPDASTASGASNVEARGIVVAQALDFSHYRNKLAGQVAAAPSQKTAETKQSASGKIVAKVEVPLGLPLLIGGLRAASLQVIATATLADYVGGGGLGRFIFAGVQTQDYPQMLAGSILVIFLAIASEILFSIIQRLVVPAGVTAGRPKDVRVKSSRSRAALG